MKIVRTLFIMVITCLTLSGQSPNDAEDIKGVNFVAPRNPIEQQVMAPIQEIGANYVAIVPYAFSYAEQPKVIFDTTRQWWGERKEGCITTIKYARNMGLNIMLKPHVWVLGQGWPGDFQLQNEKEWQEWERQYREYILTFAQVAQDLGVEIYCIGTEYRHAAVQRRSFWVRLIADVRQIYEGKITYAANWDNYQKVSFWNYLDFIGLDAYFPLVEHADPSLNELKAGWIKMSRELKQFSRRWTKPILFTEYGYQSMDYAAGAHWELDPQEQKINLDLQRKAYMALFQTVWNQPWFAGGFLWKWHAHHQRSGGSQNKSWTPQNKPAQEAIRSYYLGN